MNLIETDVVKMYESLEMSVEDIVSELAGELSEVSVKLVLGKYSAKYRSRDEDGATGNGAGLVKSDGKGVVMFRQNDEAITTEQHNAILQTMFDICQYSEQDAVRLKAAMYLHEEVTGRNSAKTEKRKAESVLPASILAFEESLREAQSRRQARAFPEEVLVEV